MSFKLSKQQDINRQRAIGKARAALDALNTAIGTYNATLNELRDMATQMTGGWRGEFETRSAKWQHSHRGQAVNDWIEAWENYEPLEEAEPYDGAIVEAEELPVGVEG